MENHLLCFVFWYNVDNNRLCVKQVKKIGNVMENIAEILFSAFTLLCILITYNITSKTSTYHKQQHKTD